MRPSRSRINPQTAEASEGGAHTARALKDSCHRPSNKQARQVSLISATRPVGKPVDTIDAETTLGVGVGGGVRGSVLSLNKNMDNGIYFPYQATYARVGDAVFRYRLLFKEERV